MDMKLGVKLLVLTGVMVMTGCGSSNSSAPECTATTEKDFVLNVARDAYGHFYKSRLIAVTR